MSSKRTDGRRFAPLLPAVAVLLIVAALALAVYAAANRDRLPGPKSEVSPAAKMDYPCRVDFVDVGQGDGILLRTKDAVVVIDGGEADTAYKMTGFLKDAGVKEIDCFIATHPHSDHIGAAVRIFNMFRVKCFVTTSFSEFNTPTSVFYESMMSAALAEEDCEIRFVTAGETIELGNLSLDVLGPVEESSEYNDMSVVVKARYKETAFLFTGDLEKTGEQLLLSSGADLKADVLKVGHHGSSTSTSPDFLRAVDPRAAVISCGANNEFGHPHKEILSLLEDAGVRVLRTDLDGTVTIFSDGKDIFTQR